MADHSKPQLGSTYSNFVTELNTRIDDALKWLHSVNASTATNIPQNAIRWDAGAFTWYIQTSATVSAPAWSIFTSRLDIANFNGAIGTTTPNTGSFTTITTSGIASLGASSTVGGVAITTASNTQILTNKTLTDPVISRISNTGLVSFPNITDTLVGRVTTDTLTNKTLTDPKFTSASGLKDANGINLILFPSAVVSAVNYITVSNSITATAPTIAASGTDANISLNLQSKGTGIVQVNGVQIVDLSSSQLLTNKTLSTPTIAAIVSGGFTLTIPITGNDTLANLTGIQALTNKTFTASAFNGTVGATTPSTGAFTTISGSSIIVTGTATAATFSGAGTSITGTASGLSIGGTAAVSTNATITNDIATATTVYLSWVTSNSGNLPIKVSSTNLTFVPSTGTLSATTFSGAGTGLTGTAASLTAGAANSVAWTNVSGRPTDLNQFANASGFVTSSGNILSATYASYVNNANAYTNGTDGWWRSAGAAGWYNATYAVGIYATQVGRVDTYNSAAFYSASNITAFSDERVKTNWRNFSSSFIEELAKVKSGTYDRTDIELTQVGVSAQSLAPVMPYAVILDEQGKYSVNYGNAALVAAVELAKEIVILKEEIKLLKGSK